MQPNVALPSVKETTLEKKIDAAVTYLFRKLSGFFASRQHLRDEILALCSDRVTLPAGHTIARQGNSYERVFLLEAGWVLRSKSMEDGRRQIVNVALPGDFLCFNATMFEQSDYDLVARTDISAFRLETKDFDKLLNEHATLAITLAWMTAHEEALLAERIVSLGRRPAPQRLAHILCELDARMRVLELVNTETMSVPLTQEEFADILGISAIHVNRSLRRLQIDGLIDYRLGEIEILDRNKLAQYAQFDESYLHFNRSDFRKTP